MSLIDKVGRFIDDVLLLPEDLREELARADAAIDEGKAAEAVERFERVLGERPGLVRALYGLARARAALGDVGAARAAITEARAIEPDNPDVALVAARLALDAGDAESAAEAARDAARRLVEEGGARLAEACALRAYAEWRRGRPDRAARELRKALAAAPDHVPRRADLVEALAAAHDPSSARVAATGLDASKLDEATATRVGLALYRAGVVDLAEPFLERGASAGHPAALVVTARAALARGALDDAEHRARRAVARGGGPDALIALAEIALALGRAAEAADAVATAAGLRHDDSDLLRTAVRIAPLDDVRALVRHADALDRVAPGDPAAVAARALAHLGAGTTDSARALAPELVDDEPRAILARARLALADGRAQDALLALDRLGTATLRAPLLALDAASADEIRKEALRALWRGPDGEVDLAAAIDAVARFAEAHDLGPTERRALALRDELDRPLVLAVLGEFNTGKSTLINAFVGADVAPTGILPTTATLNVLRAGAERRVRVVRKDGTTREGEYDALRSLLKTAESESSEIDHVEIFLPSETLERVWILDTPGTNALDPAHELLAREAMRRADAALWVFSAGQAGKATEGRLLAALRASRRTVVPVVNKVDHLSPEDLSRVLESLDAEMPELAGEAVPISARGALAARLASDDLAYAASGFPALLERLESAVFSRSRSLKRVACAGRLLEVLDDALASEESITAAYAERVARLEQAAAPLATTAAPVLAAVDDTIRQLETALDRAFALAADEVLSFVRPRTNRFATHGADPEDRAFLVEVIERHVRAAADESAARIVARVRGVLAEPCALVGDGHAQALDARVRAAVSPALAGFMGYQRGLLAGGALRRFFDDFLPRASLAREPIVQALETAQADPRAHLRPALAESLAALVAALESDRASELVRTRNERERVVARTSAPLRALREVLETLM